MVYGVLLVVLGWGMGVGVGCVWVWGVGGGGSRYPLELVEVYTMAGIPTVALNESCGYLDTQPPQEAKVCGIHCGGVAVVCCGCGWPWFCCVSTFDAGGEPYRCDLGGVVRCR